MIEREFTDEIRTVIAELLRRAETIANPVSRLDALYLLWQAVFPLGGQTRQEVLEALVTACRVANSWKASKTLREATLTIAQESPVEADRFIACMPDGKYKRQTVRRLALGEKSPPRRFFRN